MSNRVSMSMVHWDRQSRYELRKLFSVKDAGLVPRTYKIPLIKHKITPKSIESYNAKFNNNNNNNNNNIKSTFYAGRSQWPRGLRFTCWDCEFESRRGRGCLFLECFVLSGRGLCVGLITHPEEPYRQWCVWVWSEASILRRPWATRGCRAFFVGGRELVHRNNAARKQLISLNERQLDWADSGLQNDRKIGRSQLVSHMVLSRLVQTGHERSK